MNQTGHIVEIKDETTALFQMKRLSAWATCKKCLSSMSSESEEIIVEVDNSIGAEVGDKVEVSMEQINVIQAVALVYAMPLFFLLLGVIGSSYVLKLVDIQFSKEIISAIVGITFMATSYLYLKKNDKKFKESKKFIPIVTRVIVEL